MAGPVRNGRVQLTNVDISLDERDFDIPIRIINDMGRRLRDFWMVEKRSASSFWDL